MELGAAFGGWSYWRVSQLNDPSLLEYPSLHLRISICVDITFGLGNLYEGVLTFRVSEVVGVVRTF